MIRAIAASASGPLTSSLSTCNSGLCMSVYVGKQQWLVHVVSKCALPNIGLCMSVSNSAHLKAQSVLLVDALYDINSATSADYRQKIL